MYAMIRRSFGGLTADYYIRHLILGAMVPVLLFVTSGPRAVSMPASLYLAVVVNTLLYPYARFVYERVIGFVMGRNVFIVNAILALVVKAVTMAFCWSVAIVLGPIGLLWLYFKRQS